MSVCIVNLAGLDPASNGGLSRVAAEMSRLLVDLSEDQPTFYPIFAVGDHFASQFAHWIGRKASVIPIDPLRPARPILRGLNPDLIISPLFGVEPFDQIAEYEHVRHIAVMPDTLALDSPQLFTPKIRAQRQRTYERLKDTYRVVTLTEYARGRLIHHLQVAPEAIVAIHLGADLVQPDGVSPKALELPQPYLFYPANTWPHKRHELAMQVFQLVLQARPDMHLVLTGGRVADFGVNLANLIAATRVPESHVHDLGYVTDEQITSLYRNAEALLFTSQYEGFGMPILEAMRLGCPVVCAPLTAIPEVAGGAALYVNADDPRDWAQAILNELPKQRASLIERGQQRAASFSWKQTREHYHDFLVDAAPDVFGEEANASQPMVSLPMALHELEVHGLHSTHIDGVAAQNDSLTSSGLVDLNVHLNYMEALLRQEKQSPAGRVPVIGIAVRALIRMRNMGRFWRSSSAVAREIVRRQLLLAAKLDAHSDS